MGETPHVFPQAWRDKGKDNAPMRAVTPWLEKTGVDIKMRLLTIAHVFVDTAATAHSFPSRTMAPSVPPSGVGALVEVGIPSYPQHHVFNPFYIRFHLGN
jgi:hypothetical protein